MLPKQAEEGCMGQPLQDHIKSDFIIASVSYLKKNGQLLYLFQKLFQRERSNEIME